MHIAGGALAALVTWAVLVVALILVGLAPAVTSHPGRSLKTLRVSMWWGLLIITLAVLLINLFVPLRGPTALWGLLGVAVVFAAAGLLAYSRRRAGIPLVVKSRLTSGSVVLLVVVGLGLAYMAVAALGPVTNYDTGLYHLGAIKYSGDYATIPGIANLMNPIGYNNSLFPVAAVLGNGPWNGIGYRLVNGLFMAMMATDLLLRMLERRKSVGTYILLVSIVASWIPLIALSDYWVTSPTSDSSVLILSLVAVSYFADSMQKRVVAQPEALVAVLLSVLIVAMRPTMVFFLASIVVIIVVRMIKSRSVVPKFSKLPWICVASLTAALFVVQAVRDYRLSGWLEYPLSLVHFEVPWAAADPVYLRTATLGAARDPQNLWSAATGWAWVPAWFSHALTQWETYFFAVACAVAVALSLLAWRRTKASPGRLLIALTPSAITVAAWWCLSPPSYRFIWGPLFSLALVPMGWALHSLSKGGWRFGRVRPFSTACYAGAGLVAALIVFCALVRLDLLSMTEARSFQFGPISLAYVVTPIPRPPTAPVTMTTGLVIQVPTQSDQCWDVYPLCASGMDSTVGMLGKSIQDGFSH